MTAAASVVPLSSAQQRLWFLQQLEPTSTAYRIAGGVDLQGDVSLPALRQTLVLVVQRHDALRTGSVERGGTPVQVVFDDLDVPLAITEIDIADGDVTTLGTVASEEAERPFDLAPLPCFRCSAWVLPDTCSSSC
jgi:hypothetical protein